MLLHRAMMDFLKVISCAVLDRWAEHAVVEPELAGLVKVDANISDIKQHFGVLGFNGWTALWGLQETAEVQAGHNVLVSAAAGATGVLACQIAENFGRYMSMAWQAGRTNVAGWRKNSGSLRRSITRRMTSR